MFDQILPYNYFSREEESNDYWNYETYTKPVNQMLHSISSRIPGMYGSGASDNYELEIVVSVMLLTALAVSAIFLKTSKEARKLKNPADQFIKVVEKLEVDFKTSANKGVLTIRSPLSEPKPVEVNFAFCVDTSESMFTNDQKGQSRESAVKHGLKQVLNAIQKVVEAGNARFHVSVTGFNQNAWTICSITEMSSSDQSKLPMRKIYDSIKKYSSSGSTSIIDGLRDSSAQLLEMSHINPRAKNVLVLLSDGQGEYKNKIDLDSIFRGLTHQIFSIGIGKEHNKETLQSISRDVRYFDTTQKISIEKALAETYERSLRAFTELMLRANGLPAKKWGVINWQESDDSSAVELEPIAVNQLTKKLTLKIHGKQLENPLDLRQVAFELSYKDPDGLKGKVKFSWNPDTILDPAILNNY